MKWVSVEDELPKIGAPVWVAGNGNIMVGGRGDDGDVWLWGQCYSFYYYKGAWEGDIDMDDDYGWITHWQPLPELPEDI